MKITKITFLTGMKVMNENYGGNKFESTDYTTHIEFLTTPETENLTPLELYNLAKKDLIELAETRLKDVKATIAGDKIEVTPATKPASPFSRFKKPLS